MAEAIIASLVPELYSLVLKTPWGHQSIDMTLLHETINIVQWDGKEFTPGVGACVCMYVRDHTLEECHQAMNDNS